VRLALWCLDTFRSYSSLNSANVDGDRKNTLWVSFGGWLSQPVRTAHDLSMHSQVSSRKFLGSYSTHSMHRPCGLRESTRESEITCDRSAASTMMEFAGGRMSGVVGDFESDELFVPSAVGGYVREGRCVRWLRGVIRDEEGQLRVEGFKGWEGLVVAHGWVPQ